MRHDEDQRSLRRLLNHFEQGVGAVAVQVLGRIHDRNPPSAKGGGELEDLQSLPHGFDRNLARKPLRCALPLAADQSKIGMGEPREKPRCLMRRLDMEVARFADRFRGRIRVGEHKAGEPPGERRLADPFPAPDQPGMRKAALAIGRQHFRFGAFVADQRIDMTRMGRAGERVGFREDRRSRLFSCGAGSCAELRRWRFGTAAPQGPHAEEPPRKRGVSKHAPALDAVGARESALRGRFAALQDEGQTVGNYSCELGLERGRRIEPALDRRPNGRGDSSSLPSASMTAQRKGSAAAMSRNARRRV